MAKIKIYSNYKSGWLTVTAPSLVFIVVLFGVPALFYFYTDVEGYLWALMIVGDFVVAGVLCVLANILFQKIASGDQRQIGVDGNLITWSKNKKQHTIDLKKSFVAEIHAGASYLSKGISIEIHDPGLKELLNIYINGLDADEASQVFPDRYFFENYSLSPSEGMFGFEMAAKNSEEKMLFMEILRMLWEYRKKNRYFEFHEMLDLESTPDTESDFVKLLDSENDKDFIEKFKHDADFAAENIFINKDYVLAEDVYSGKLGEIKFWLMPLGHIRAEFTTRPSVGFGTVKLYQESYFSLIGKLENAEEIAIYLPAGESVSDLRLKQSTCQRFVNERLGAVAR